MNRAAVFSALIVPMAVGLAAGQSDKPDVRTWKLYDVRDLIGLLPPDQPGPGVTGQAGMLPHTGISPTAAGDSEEGPVDTLVGRLCDAFGAPYERLVDGVYGVEADDETHDLLRRLLTEVRALHTERYAVDVAWFSFAEGDRPGVGKAITLPALATSHSLVVTRRTPTAFDQVVRQQFVSGMTPVVADGVVAYEPETSAALDGLRAIVQVGASKDDEGATTLRLRGGIYRAELGRLPARLATGMDSSPAVELPAESLRTLRADVRVPFAQWTTLAVVPGFAEGMTVVVAVRVEPLAVD